MHPHDVPSARRGPAVVGAGAALVLALALFGAPGCSCGGEPIAARTVDITVSPAALDFADVPLGAAFERTLLVSNRGNAPWSPPDGGHIDGAAFALVQGCPGPLAPRATCTARIRFAPPDVGPAAGTLAFDVDGTALAVPLTGRGTPATIRVTPDALDFGTVAVGDSTPLAFHVDNIGTVAVDVDVALAGPGFVVGGAAGTTLHVDAGASIDVDVTFAPVGPGPVDGSAVVELCGRGCGPRVALHGAGTAPRIDVQPRTIDFGAVAVGQQASAVMTIANVGEGDLRVDAVRVRGDGAAGSDARIADGAPTDGAPLVLSAGAHADVTVVFAPTTGQASLASVVEIVSSDPVSSSVLIPLVGSADGPGLQVLPAAIHFGHLDDGDVREADFVVRSIGTVAAQVTSVQVESSPSFVLVSDVPATALPPGRALQLRVRAQGSAAAGEAGGAQGRVVVEAAAMAPLAIPLQFAAGTAGCQARGRPTDVALGTVRIRESTRGAVVVENVGDAPCTLRSAAPADGLPFDDGFTFATRGVTTLGPGARGVVDVSFDAIDDGTFSAVLALAFDDVEAPLLVSASARAIRAGLSAAPPVVTFGPMPAACLLPDQNVAFLNSSATRLDLETLALLPDGGPFAFDAPPLPAPMVPGASLGVGVSATATALAPGHYERTLRGTADNGEQDASVRLILDVTPEDTPIVQEFTTAQRSSVDILFVVDNSGSMLDDQELLAANFDAFFAGALATRGLDFQLGVATTDIFAQGGQLFGVPPILDDATGALEQVFGDHVRVGADGAGVEMGLEAMRMALEQNPQLVRRDASLSVVFVSDEEDNGAFPELLPDPGMSRAPAEYVALLRALKAGSLANTPILVSAVLQPGSGRRYEDVVQAFSGVTLDITSPTWGEQLEQIGEATFALGRTFTLSGEPRADTVVVTVDGAPVTAFVVDATRHTVTLDTPADPGSQVVISWVPQC